MGTVISAIAAAWRRARSALPRVPGVATVTGVGWIVLAASVGAWVLGAWLGWIELFLAAATGLLTLVVCALFTIGRTVLRIELVPLRRRITEGERTDVDVTVTNLARQPLILLTLETVIGDRPVPVPLPARLAGNGGHRTVRLPLPGSHRGVVPVGPATSVRGDPLGLLRRRVPWTGVVEVFVHPKTVRLEPFGGGLLRDLEGRTTEDVSMSDLAFHTLREYVPGDDRRYIHWRSSAKVGSASATGTFLVRQFRDTRRTHLLVIVDGTPASYPDPAEFETAISVGASMALRATEDELDATLLVADQPAYRQSGRTATPNQVLDLCSRAGLRGKGLASLVAEGARVAPDATYALVVTGGVADTRMLRRVTAQLPNAVRTTVVRVDTASPPRMLTAGNPSMLSVARAEDLRKLLGRGEAA